MDSKFDLGEFFFFFLPKYKRLFAWEIRKVSNFLKFFKILISLIFGWVSCISIGIRTIIRNCSRFQNYQSFQIFGYICILNDYLKYPSEKDLNLHEYHLYRWLKSCQFPKMPRERDFRVPYKVKSRSKSAPHKVRRRVYCYNSLIPPRNAHSAHSYPRANIECRIDQSRLGQSWTGSKPVVEKKFPDACSSKEMTLDI